MAIAAQNRQRGMVGQRRILQGLANRPAIAGNGRPIGQTLQDAALADHAALPVLGGYGHSRLRDFLPGGSTSGVLTHPSLSLLLSPCPFARAHPLTHLSSPTSLCPRSLQAMPLSA
ncbi:hypothetical protein VW29_17910, partial [Devosia limi DSM 17137]